MDAYAMTVCMLTRRYKSWSTHTEVGIDIDAYVRTIACRRRRRQPRACAAEQKDAPNVPFATAAVFDFLPFVIADTSLSTLASRPLRCERRAPGVGGSLTSRLWLRVPRVARAAGAGCGVADFCRPGVRADDSLAICEALALVCIDKRDGEVVLLMIRVKRKGARREGKGNKWKTARVRVALAARQSGTTGTCDVTKTRTKIGYTYIAHYYHNESDLVKSSKVPLDVRLHQSTK